MDPKVLGFLDKNRVCILATVLKNGSPHASTMHYSYTETPFQIYIQTRNTSKKCESLLTGEPGKASIAIGFSEEDFKTLQLDGEVKILGQSELDNAYKIHYKKYPEDEKRKTDPGTVFLVFKPVWWRYTEYKPELLVLSSEDSK